MKKSRYAAVGLVAAAALWIFSGHLGPHGKGESVAANRPAEAPTAPLFRVSVMTAEVAPHVRQLYLSGRTEAEHKVMITSRTNGLLEKLNVKRGQAVKEGEVVAVLSDEAREAQVEQATALLNQRKAELEARRKLIDQGTLPRLDGVNLESQFRTAAASLAAAEAERDRGVIRAPWAGIITDVPTVAGQPMSPGKEIAQLVSLDPMLAIVEVSERKLGGVKLGAEANIKLVDGQVGEGPRALRLEVRKRDDAHLSRRSRHRQCRRRDPGRHHLRDQAVACAGAGGARAALVADVLLRGRTGRARRRRAGHGRVRSRAGAGRRPDADVGRRHRLGVAGDRAGPGFRARRPARRAGAVPGRVRIGELRQRNPSCPA